MLESLLLLLSCRQFNLIESVRAPSQQASGYGKKQHINTDFPVNKKKSTRTPFMSTCSIHRAKTLKNGLSLSYRWDLIRLCVPLSVYHNSINAHGSSVSVLCTRGHVHAHTTNHEFNWIKCVYFQVTIALVFQSSAIIFLFLFLLLLPFTYTLLWNILLKAATEEVNIK